MNIIERIDDLCRLHNMSKYRLSQITGISQSAFSKMSRQQSTLSLETVQRISDALNIPLSVLFEEPPEPLTCFPLALYQKSFNKLDIRAQSQALAVLRLLFDPDLTDND